MIQFYDSTTPSVIPNKDYAALYWDGDFGSVGQESAHLFKHIRRITVTGNPDHAGIIDYEPDNPAFTQARLFDYVSTRARDKRFCVVYAARVNLMEAWDTVGNFNPLWWIPTLDGIEWTPETLAKNCAEIWDAPIPVSRIWANQNVGVKQNGGHNWDRSNLFLNW